MAVIKSILPRQILDSRGNPTIEVDIFTENGIWGRAAVPSGASTGTREALELRDGNKEYYLGKSVLKAIQNIKDKIAPALIGKSLEDQRAIDDLMLAIDGTENKESLGANAILAVSLACAKTASTANNLPLYRYLKEKLHAPYDFKDYVLPAPLMNIINGGQHASNGLDFQEFMIVPHIDGPFSENLRAGVEIFHNLKKVLSDKGYSTNVGDEGGFAPMLKTHEEALDCILMAIEKAGYRAGENISLSLDAAASEFYNSTTKQYELTNGDKLSTSDMISYLEKLVAKYPIYSIEDGLSEHDKSGWTQLTEKVGDKILVIGDDLFVTNKKIFQKGIEEKQANSILIKVNQIGSLSETFDTLQLAFENNFKAVISHRSGETADSFIADLAVATGAGHIKTGSASRTDRVEKYNQLLRIEEELAGKAGYNKIK
ncbi:MAG: phosphopyruvate hydratase [Halobacteriovoraceae bacterium]|nr:phosphopyruvate hydratase [Halobacteriovoraceae bacterium]MCB9094139.1 phosphopyruvate hydratase [Halobacteriovoraceae bacterium]